MADWLDEARATPTVTKQPTIEHRVVGPPGCGKTTWLARQCKIAAAKYGGIYVCVASLTKAAAKEVAGRDTGIPPENVGTLHAYAFRGLNKPAIMETADGIKGFNHWVGAASYRISRRAIADPENATLEPIVVEDEGDQLLSEMGVLRQLMVPPEQWPPLVRAFAAKWNEYKRASGRVDFTDLIERAIKELDFMPGDPLVIMADEAQDMSRLEMRLLRKWGDAAQQLVIVGDPDQALYTWRGADPEAVFGSEAGSVTVLKQSYRVPQQVHRQAVHWIEQMTDRLPIEYHPRRCMPDDNESPFVDGEVDRRPYLWKDPEPLLDAVRAELADGKTVMLLTSCQYMLHPLTAALKRQGMPFHNPYRVANGAWNPLRAAQRLLAYLRPDAGVWGAEARFWTWDDTRLWSEPLLSKQALRHGAKTLIKTHCVEGIFGKLDTRAHDEVRFSDMLHHIAIDETAMDALLDGDLDWWERNLKHGERKTQAFPLAVARRHGARLLLDEPKLIVGTIHSVKGGEADTVYLFPDLSPTGYWNGWKLAHDDERHKGILRLFYVGMTRARRRLVLCDASSMEAVTW